MLMLGDLTTVSVISCLPVPGKWVGRCFAPTMVQQVLGFICWIRMLVVPPPTPNSSQPCAPTHLLRPPSDLLHSSDDSGPDVGQERPTMMTTTVRRSLVGPKIGSPTRF